MAGVELRGGALYVERPPNELDELAIETSGILDRLGIAHAFISGYVAILTGRSRGTEDIDLLLEQVDGGSIDRLADTLREHDMWGPAMPLSRMDEMLVDHIWVARDGEMLPRLEMKCVSDRFDEASVANRIPAHIGDATIPVGPIELQIAYKLWMGSRIDVEDALHLFGLFEESLSAAKLEYWVGELEVEEEYERLQRA